MQLAVHGRPYGFWHAYCGGDTDQTDDFENVYIGTYPSTLAYAESIEDDTGMTITVGPPSMEP